MATMLLLLLLLLLSLQGAVVKISCVLAAQVESWPTTRAHGVRDVWSSVLWNRFPEEVFPLFLSDLLKAGRVQEAQARSRVTNLTNEDFESYSGYVTVNSQYHSNLFFWFFPAQTNKTEAPVLLWLNGGPGRSSMFGALLENGPLEVDQNGPRLKRRAVPWTKYFSMLYVDNPVGVGYSFTKNDDGLSTNLKEISDNLYSLLVQFFKLFPQYSKLPFYAGGQSYAGKYVPALGFHLHERNTDPTTPHHELINFKGIYLGAGFCDPVNMLPAYPEFLYHIGMISNSRREVLKKRFHQIVTEWPHSKEPKSVNDYMNEFFGTPRRFTAIDNYDNLLGAKATNAHLIQGFNRFMGSMATRLKLHVGKAATRNTYEVRAKLSSDFMSNTSAENAFLMDNYKVLHYSGNLDIVVNVPMTEAFLEHVQWAGQEEYRRKDRLSWRVDGELAGWVTIVRNFTRVVIRNSGHMAPYDQPEFTLDMMKNFIFDLPFVDPDRKDSKKGGRRRQ